MSEYVTIAQADAAAAQRTSLRRQMAVQRQIELQMNSLIQGMRQLVDTSGAAASALEKSQLKNLLAVALETPSVEVVKHYILYLVGRDAAGSSWRRADFGKNLVKALGDLEGNAKRICTQVQRDLDTPDPTPEEVDEAWMALVRNYLGQLNRYFYYAKEDQRKEGGHGRR